MSDNDFPADDAATVRDKTRQMAKDSAKDVEDLKMRLKAALRRSNMVAEDAEAREQTAKRQLLIRKVLASDAPLKGEAATTTPPDRAEFKPIAAASLRQSLLARLNATATFPADITPRAGAMEDWAFGSMRTAAQSAPAAPAPGSSSNSPSADSSPGSNESEDDRPTSWSSWIAKEENETKPPRQWPGLIE